ncbi:vWA domain-containing protein [Candidatus Liberibacter americanus]|uniref:Flp pilus assembly protein TadG n=1 Tax=Candidatus Liberibacter americanus str. Sao Paulo TaxID=1261131 RepID=U6B5G1_9HYPH|nr:VWA domain-containing protein [Candidatus Liberibacter americanus]AHA28195.1 Flp pilus assembly protein TadG [Candidatus Liberibacter americanus str. Sao Paulo]EMS36290.1 hypothetical protein G653_02659 [Candidatus Liberibacter americanus PW_SP]
MFFLYPTKFNKNKCGSFTIMTAIILPILIMLIAFIVDVSNIVYTKSVNQYLTDKVVIDSSLDIISDSDYITDNQVRESIFENIKKVLKKEFSKNELEKILDEAKININKDANNNRHITLNISYPFYHNKLSILYLIKDNGSTRLENTSTVLSIPERKSINYVYQALSSYFVIDVSGSMNNRFGNKPLDINDVNEINLYLDDVIDPYNFIDPNNNEQKYRKNSKAEYMVKYLKEFIKTLENNYKDDKLLRTGLISYNTIIVKHLPINNGTKHINDYIDKIYPYGLTNSYIAMEKAYKSFINIEDSVDNINNEKYIVFMTDGENTHSTDDDLTIKICDMAKKRGIKIITVAIDINKPGPISLLTRCSSENRVYIANNHNDMKKIFMKVAKSMIDSHKRIIISK